MSAAGGPSARPGTAVQQAAKDDTAAAQLWAVSADSAGLILEPFQAQDKVVLSRRGDEVVVDADQYTGQRWRLHRMSDRPVIGGSYSIIPATSPGLALDVSSWALDPDGKPAPGVEDVSGVATQDWSCTTRATAR